MNSDKWQDLLQHIQQVVVQIPMQHRPLAVALKHLRFAKHRFDSAADPMAKVAFMLLPLATLLAFIGSDERHKLDDRERAKKCLKKLDSKFALAIGVSADWGLVCQSFLRLFDTNQHDIALTYREVTAFKEVLRILFAEGAVFTCRNMQGDIRRPEKLPAIGGYFGIAGVKPAFVTQTVEETLRQKAVFNCGREQILLWGPNRPADVQEMRDRLKFITAHVIDRVNSEFDPLERFKIFDVAAVREAWSAVGDRASAVGDGANGERRRWALNRHVRTLAQELGVDGTVAAREYRQIAILICDQTAPGRPLAAKGNNEVWAAMMSPNVALSHLPRVQNLQALHVVIRFYLSIEDGECPNERDLGDLLKIMGAHTNGTDSLADDVILAQDDPITSNDIRSQAPAVGGIAGAVSLGPKGRLWAHLWRRVYGARIGVFGRRRQVAGPEKEGENVLRPRCKKRPGTYAAAKFGVLAAAEYAVADHKRRRGAPQDEAAFVRSAVGDLKPGFGNKDFDRFADLTAKKKQRAQIQLRSIALRWKSKPAAQPARRLEGVRRVCFLGDIGASLPHPVTADAEELIGATRTWKAQLAVVDDLTRLHMGPDTSEQTMSHVLVLFGRGVPVVTSASWELARGDPHAVPKESVIRHRPLAIEKTIKFVYTPHFAARKGLIVRALERLATLPGSKWKVSAAPAGAAAAGAAAAVGAGCLLLDEAHGTDRLRTWIQENRRICNVQGSRAWTTTERIL